MGLEEYRKKLSKAKFHLVNCSHIIRGREQWEGNNPKFHKEYLANKFDLPIALPNSILQYIELGWGVVLAFSSPHLTFVLYHRFLLLSRGNFYFFSISVVAREIQNNRSVSLESYV